MPRARPGLPRCGKQVAVGRAGECRTRRLLLVFRRVRCRRHGLEFQHVVACSGGRESPGPRSSVALPLGINGSAARGGQGAGTTLLSWTGGASVGPTSIAKWRIYAGGGSGPRDPLGRRSSVFFCWVRPRARPLAPAFGVRCAPRTAIPDGIALFALSLGELKPAGPKSNVSCGPPAGRRPARATLKGRKSTTHSSLLSSSPPAGTARLKEPQKHCPRPGQWNSIKHRPVSLRDALTGANRIFHPRDSPRRTAYETKNTLRLSEKWEKSSL